MLGNFLAGDDRADRQCRAVQPFAGGDQIGFDAWPMHVAEPFAKAADAADYFVINP